MTLPKPVVYFVDDDAGILTALTRLCRGEPFDIRTCGSAREFLDVYQADTVACLVLDVTMPEIDGLELQRRLTAGGSLIPIVFLTGKGTIPMGVRAIKEGAVDFLTKPVDADDLLRSVRAALRIAEERHRELREMVELRANFAKLTPREREVLVHVVAGKPNKRIAAELGTGEQTIKVHRGRVMDKMGTESLADLVRAAGRLGIGPPPRGDA